MVMQISVRTVNDFEILGHLGLFIDSCRGDIFMVLLPCYKISKLRHKQRIVLAVAGPGRVRRGKKREPKPCKS